MASITSVIVNYYNTIKDKKDAEEIDEKKELEEPAKKMKILVLKNNHRYFLP